MLKKLILKTNYYNLMKIIKISCTAAQNNSFHFTPILQRLNFKATAMKQQEHNMTNSLMHHDAEG